MATITLNGQTFELDDSIAGDDVRLKDALAPYAPDIHTAQITRTQSGDKLIVTITKRAGTKGTGPTPLAVLAAAPAWVNPALTLAWELKHRETTQPLDLAAWVDLYPQIDAACRAGETAVREVTTALTHLHATRPVPAPLLLPGS
jgi:hypothetical protein